MFRPSKHVLWKSVGSSEKDQSFFPLGSFAVGRVSLWLFCRRRKAAKREKRKIGCRIRTHVARSFSQYPIKIYCNKIFTRINNLKI
ncbi:hypothetical protein GTCCBUS3UF5_31950 [Geobacillus thermoleovorans CCB_US3_UF5]|uniref:Uncharacterized protein n=1 Tax=Geobacillus thermoleovorans CCB_US3_UF5 TaxID=1111068 RepID=A0ABM5ML31_GEOTH|nr:hypothetical protein GTCCBUS3UF5_31950 [Geobacillus thermoleovorans CCB_US3_UF5]